VAPMTTHVHEGTEPTVARACNHYGDLTRRRCEIGTVFPDLSCVADVLPRVREDPLAFTTKDFRVDIPRPGQSPLHAPEL
jgi:hypothetical protein